MSYYLLDTNICIHLLKGEYNIQNKINQAGIDSCFLSEITIAELLYGIENSAPTRQQQNRKNLQNLQTLFYGRVLPISDAFYEYAHQKATLKRLGRVVGEFDLLIGSTAIVNKLILVTRNTRHFSDMIRIQLENWVD